MTCIVTGFPSNIAALQFEYVFRKSAGSIVLLLPIISKNLYASIFCTGLLRPWNPSNWPFTCFGWLSHDLISL